MVDPRALQRYIGMPYDAEKFDCADLAVLLQLELFGKHIALPSERARRTAQAATIRRYRTELAFQVPPEQIRDGDVVIMQAAAPHIGTLFKINGAWRVLHNSRSLGSVWLHRLGDLPGIGLFIEGFYRWN